MLRCTFNNFTVKVLNMSEEERPEVLDEGEAEEEEQEEVVEEEAQEPEAAEEEKAEEELEEEEVYYEDAVNKGDFIMVEMTGRAQETGEIFETTDEELAREEGAYREGATYGLRLVVVGEGWVLKGLDERLPGTELDEEVEIEIPPAEAFGERNADLVQMVPYRILRSKGVNPVVGAELEIDGRPAVIRSIGAGRVQVDYNHPLAGRNIVYNLKVVEQIENDKKKIQALVSRRFLGVESDKFKVRKLKKKIRVEMPDEVFFGENIQIAKRGLALDILRYFEEPEEVEFTEVVKRT